MLKVTQLSSSWLRAPTQVSVTQKAHVPNNQVTLPTQRLLLPSSQLCPLPGKPQLQGKLPFLGPLTTKHPGFS